MGATNRTTYYNLSQFIGTDKPAWLQDYNGDMLKIDTGINAAKVAADAAALAAGTAQSTADGAVSSLGTLSTTVSAHTTAITNLSGVVNTINSLIGNGTPTTTDQTIIGAINELDGKMKDNNLATPVDITAYTSGSPYVFPSDGYLEVRAPYGTGNYISAALTGSNGNNVVEITSTASDHAVGSALFVKKGMKAYTLNTNNGTLKFIAIE